MNFHACESFLGRMSSDAPNRRSVLSSGPFRTVSGTTVGLPVMWRRNPIIRTNRARGPSAYQEKSGHVVHHVARSPTAQGSTARLVRRRGSPSPWVTQPPTSDEAGTGAHFSRTCSPGSLYPGPPPARSCRVCKTERGFQHLHVLNN